MSRTPRAIRPWLLMLLMLGAATVLRVALEPVLGERFPLLTYYPMTVFLALFAGPWPAVVGRRGGRVVRDAVRLRLHHAGRLVALAIYVPTNVLLIVLVERVRRTARGRAAVNAPRAQSETSSVAHRGLLATALESVDAGVHSWDPASGEAQWDARLRSLFGFDLGEPATHAALLDRVHPDDRRALRRRNGRRGRRSPAPGAIRVEYRIFRAATEQCVGWRARASRCSKATGSCASSARSATSPTSTGSRPRYARASGGSRRWPRGRPVLLWVNGLEGGEFVNRAYLEFLGVAVQPGRARLRLESVLASGRSRRVSQRLSDARSPRRRVSPPSFVFAVTTANTAGCAPTRRRGSVKTASSRATSARPSTSPSGATPRTHCASRIGRRTSFSRCWRTSSESARAHPQRERGLGLALRR